MEAAGASLYYNHPFWPSPRAARIAKLFLEMHEMPRGLGWTFEQAWLASGRPKKPEGRLTHDKALKVMADYLGLSVHEFLHIKPVDAILRLKLVDPRSFNAEEKAWRILGNTILPVWWGGRMPCCVVCDRMLPPAPAPAPAPAAPLPEPPEPATVVPVRDPPLSPAAAPAAPTSAYDRLQQRLAALSPGPALPALPALPDRLQPPPGYVLWSEPDDPCSCRCLGRSCHCFPIMHDGAGRLWFVTGPGEVWRHPPSPASTTQAPAGASAELIETLMEFLKEMNGIVTTGDQRYVTALVQRFKGRVV